MTGGLHLVSDRRPDFPWTKLERLLREPEIFRPQWEDGLPDEPTKAVPMQSFDPHQCIWILMDGLKARGFVAVGLRGLNWGEVHAGFRNGTPGLAKKRSIVFVCYQMFMCAGLRKLSTFTPEFNLPARVMARSCGWHYEGRIANCCWRNGKGYSRLVYGIERDEFLDWLKRQSQQRSGIPAEQPIRWTAVSGQCADECAGEREHPECH